MKIVFTLDTLLNAGTEKSTLDIVRNFSSEAEVVVVYFYPKHDLREAYLSAGIRLIFLDLSGKYDFTRGVSRLMRLIKKEKPDVVVSSIARANLISRIACKITGTTLIGTFVNDSYGYERIKEHKVNRKHSGFRFFWKLDKLTSGVPSFWIANSASIAMSNSHALGVKSEKIKVIYRGRDVTLFPEWFPPNNNGAGKFRFVFIGRLLNRKGVFELLSAIKLLTEDFNNFQIDVYGGGEAAKEMKKEIEKLQISNFVFLHGSVMNGFLKLYEANCFVFPSWYEGFSGSLIEAMMSGIPIIASDIPMNLEAITRSETALVHQVKNEKDLALKMRQMILQYPAMRQMGKRARLDALKRFDIKVIAAQYEAFLQAVVGGQ